MSDKKFWCLIVPVLVILLCLFSVQLYRGNRVEMLEKEQVHG